MAKPFGIVKSMPMIPDIVVWRALLSTCGIHCNVSFGEHVMNYVEKLDCGSYSGTNMLLSNFWIEVNGFAHEFRVADALHRRIVGIREKLSEVLKKVGAIGYAADSSHISFDLNEGNRDEAVGWHSEKLGVAFGLMITTPGACIQIMKNVRTCEDCHKVLKAISEVYDREIVVRYCSRFHTFREGKCSRKDYW
ncbi:hypothetical protein OROGR_021291 [Orobanche gracilis]